MNFGTANNWGLEVDILKYFNWLGIKANYTYTYSKITTEKRVMQGSEVTTTTQSRPLFGQAAHVANISFLLKDSKHGYVHQSERTANVDSERDNSNLVERKSWHGQSLMIGARFRL